MLEFLITSGLVAAAPLASGCGAEAAQGFEAESSIAFVSDYRARGITVSDNAFAVQGGVTVEHSSGFSVGAWASSMAEAAGGNLELDLIAAKTFSLGEAELSLGGTAYVYPDSDDLNYGEFNTSISASVGPIDGTVGVAYAWDQENIGSDDNLYVFLNGVTTLGEVAGLPLALGGSVGYEDGPLAVESTKYDWSLSLTLDFAGATLGVSYVDTDLHDSVGDPAGVVSLSKTF